MAKVNTAGSTRCQPRRVVCCVLVIVFLGASLAVFLGLGFYFPHRVPIEYTRQELSELKTVQAHGSNLYLKEQAGTGPAIIFLHGYGASLSVWNDQFSLLPNRHLVALDLIGFGGSEKPGIHYDLLTQASYLKAMLQQLDLNAVVLVGHSMGASIAATYAAMHPDQVKGLVLVTPSAYPGSLQFSRATRWMLDPGIPNSVLHYLTQTKLFKGLFPDSSAHQILGITGSYNQQFADLLPKITQTTLLLWSAGDRQVPIHYKDEYLDRIADVEFVTLPKSAGHKLTQEVQTIIASELYNMLSVQH